MTKAEAFELLALGHRGLLAQTPPLLRRDLCKMQLKLMGLLRGLLPPVVERDATARAQQIAVPIFAPADAPVACLEGADAAFGVIVGTRKLLAIVAVDQIRSSIGEHLQELLKTLMLDGAERPIVQMLSQGLPPVIKPASDLLVADGFFGGGPTPIQDMLGIQYPLAHAFDLRNLVLPGSSCGHQRLQPSQLLQANRAQRGPFFSSCSKLLATPSRASAAATAG